jgi:hypothetical protein
MNADFLNLAFENLHRFAALFYCISLLINFASSFSAVFSFCSIHSFLFIYRAVGPGEHRWYKGGNFVQR